MAVNLDDPDVRERLAERAYYRERLDEAAADSEHVEDAGYWTLDWQSLSDWAKRPYRTAVAEACDVIASAGVA
jgi:hypothetical protein